MEVDRHDLRIYGLAYWSDDPDGACLYIFHRERDTNRQTIHKVNVETNDTTFVAYLDPEAGGSLFGAFITDKFDPYSMVFIDIANTPPDDGGDRIDIWQLHTNTGWIQIEPMEGILEADDRQEFDLTLDAVDLLSIEYPGELVFTHNALEGEAYIPITLSIIEGPHQAVQILQLEMGWNMVSVYLQPDEDDVVVLTRDLVEQDLLLMMKDGDGHFYSPAFGFNNIPGWDVAQGYLMKMAQAGELSLEGMTVNWD